MAPSQPSPQDDRPLEKKSGDRQPEAHNSGTDGANAKQSESGKASPENHAPGRGSNHAGDEEIDEIVLKKTIHYWQAIKTYFRENLFGGTPPTFHEEGSPEVDNAAVPAAIAASVCEVKRSPYAILFTSCISSLAIAIVPYLDKYIVSSEGWSLTFFLQAVATALCMIAMMAIGNVKIKGSWDSFKFEGSKYLIPLYVVLHIVKEYTHLRALQTISIPVQSIFRLFPTIIFAIGFGIKSTSVLGFMSFLFFALSCLQAVAVDFFYAFSEALMMSWKPGAGRVLASTALTSELSGLAFGYAWLGAHVFCMLICFLLWQYIAGATNLKEREVLVHVNLVSVPFSLLCSYLFEGLSRQTLEANFPAETRTMLILATIYSALGPVVADVLSTRCRAVMSWDTNAILKAMDIIPVTMVDVFLSVPLDFGSVYPIVLGFFSGVLVFVGSWRRWRARDPPRLRNRLIVVHHILAIAGFFSSPALFNSVHRAIDERLFNIYDSVYGFLCHFMAGLAVFLTYSCIQVKQWRTNLLTVGLTVVCALATFFASTAVLTLTFASVGSMVGAVLCAMSGISIVFYQVELRTVDSKEESVDRM